MEIQLLNIIKIKKIKNILKNIILPVYSTTGSKGSNPN